MKRLLKTMLACACAFSATAQSAFTPGKLVVLQTTGTVSKGSSAATLKEYSTAGVAGMSVTLPVTGPTPYQTAGVYGGSEGFLTTSSDGKYLALAGYATAASFTDITSTLSASVTRAVGLIYPSGFYLQADTSNTFFSANDIRVAVSDGTSFWAGGASNASLDGIDYFVAGAHAALATGANPPKAYGMRIFNGNLYFSTQKAGPSNTSSQLGIFQLGTGLPTNGTPTVTQIINTGSVVPLDFSFNATGDVCYIAINLNTSAGGIQKWTKSGSTWTLAYTLGTGITNTGAYGLVVDYSGTNPVIYATTFDATGNRIIKITDAGSGSTATTLVAATAGVYFKGIAFAPVASGTPMVNISVSSDTSSEAAKSVITVTANTSAPVGTAQTVSLGISGTGITSGDYTLSNATITIPAGATSGSVTFTVADDILGEGTEKAILTLSSPSAGIVLGKRTVQTVTIFDNDGNNHPSIAMNTTATTDFIDGGVTVAPVSPFKLSGVINDPTDPAKTLGVTFKVHDLETPDTSLVTWVTSSNIAVVPVANVTIAGTDSTRIVKITPTGVGYSNITVSVTDGIDTTSYVINYGASAASATPASTFWHTGMSDASDGVPIDNNYFISGDDELNVLNVYSRSASGLPLVSFNYTSFLSLPDPTKPEVDLECSAVSPTGTNKVYWMGSMSNTKSPFNIAPNRDRIFATTYSGTGAATTFAFGGYAALRSAITAWGDSYGYNFTASAAAGVDSKSPSGFAAEGMVFGPDNTTLYIGMRTPLVPTTARTKAVIVPITNFEAWFNNGTQVGSPTFGAPIELDMNGRGVRDIIRLSNGTYVILGGDPGGAMTSAIYTWTGYAKDAPNMVPSSVSGVLNMEGVMQMNTGSVLNTTALQIITDNGDDVFYGDGTAAKDFGDLIYRKFSSNIVSSIDLTFPEINLQGNSVNINDGDTTITTADNTDFGNVAYASTTTKTFTIQNLGTKTLSVSGINFTGANTGDFSLVSAPAFPLSIAANGSQVITVQFAPQALGFRKATINILSNDADEATYDIALRGNGICNTLTIDTVKGGGTICSGATGLPVSMNISRAGLTYQLYNGPTAVGTAKAGTGAALSFGLQTTAGTYTAIATSTVTNCTTTMAGSAVINVNPLPIVDTLSGSGNYCSGGTGIAVGLSPSQINVDYQLYTGGTATGIIRHGSGSPISFGNVTGAGTYIAIANNTITGCTDTMYGSATVGIYTLPTVLSATGNVTCVGIASSVSATPSSGAAIRWYNAPSTGTLLATSSTLNITNPVSPTIYYAEAYNTTTGCISSSRATATLTVNPLPSVYHVTGGGHYCSGGTGNTISLSNSDTGINYQLYNGVATSGSSISGTGSTFGFGQRTAAGTYKVIATNRITGCTIKMADTAVISIDPLPIIDTLSGGGNYCAGGVGLPAHLSGSQSGVNYQLYLGGVATGTPVSGTGGIISFGNLTGAGNYIAIANNTTTGCTDTMYGGATIGIYILPAILSTTGNKTCAGTSSYVIALPSTGATVRWYAVPVSGSIINTGNTLNVINPSLPTVYFADAYNATTGCVSSSRATTTLTVNPLPIAFNVTGGGHYCQNTKGSEVILDSSENGIFYEVYNGTTPVGSFVAGTGHKISMGFEKAAATYSVWATNTATMCGNVMNGSVHVSIDPVPVVYTLSGGGSYCAGGSGKSISLSGSDTGINYQLYNGIVMDGTAVKGTNSPVSYGLHTIAGNYTVVATDTMTHCTDTMSGTATIAINPVVIPTVAIAMSTPDTICNGTLVNYTASITHGGVTPAYRWSVNGVIVSTLSTYNYAPSNMDTVSVALTSSEICALPASATDSTMMTVINNSTPTIAISATDSAVCDGKVVDFTSAISFGGTSPVYNWFVNGSAVSTASSFRYVPANGDIISSQLTSNYRCLITPSPVYSNTIKVSVTEPLIPMVSIIAAPGSTIKAGQPDTFMVSAANTANPSYKWYKNSTVITGVSGTTYVGNGLVNGDSISCIVTNTDVCALSSFNSLKVYTNNTGIATNAATAADVIMLPNPNSGSFVIKGSIATNDDAAITLEVTDMAGRIVYNRQSTAHKGIINENVNLGSTIASGTYLLRVASGNESQTFHVIVNR